ncbi:hypothetical protein ACIBCU_03320 [Streptomyces sp. NPDC051064]|uniref:hypothetical protein n=1 Tax=Streptomyces sp. NPDC051064 TaxID=3365641 RepID=UPI0037A65964
MRQPPVRMSRWSARHAGRAIAVGEAEDGRAAVGLVERLEPDVALMDLRASRRGWWPGCGCRPR